MNSLLKRDDLTATQKSFVKLTDVRPKVNFWSFFYPLWLTASSIGMLTLGFVPETVTTPLKNIIWFMVISSIFALMFFSFFLTIAAAGCALLIQSFEKDSSKYEDFKNGSVMPISLWNKTLVRSIMTQYGRLVDIAFVAGLIVTGHLIVAFFTTFLFLVMETVYLVLKQIGLKMVKAVAEIPGIKPPVMITQDGMGEILNVQVQRIDEKHDAI